MSTHAHTHRDRDYLTSGGCVRGLLGAAANKKATHLKLTVWPQSAIDVFHARAEREWGVVALHWGGFVLFTWACKREGYAWREGWGRWGVVDPGAGGCNEVVAAASTMPLSVVHCPLVGVSLCGQVQVLQVSLASFRFFSLLVLYKLKREHER